MKKSALEMLLLFLAFYLPGFFVRNPPFLPLTSFMLQFLLLAVPQTLLIVYIIALRGNPPLDEFGISRIGTADLIHGLALSLGLLGLFSVLSLLLTLLPENLRRIATEGYRWQSPSPAQLPLVLLFSLATGYREEIFFRSYLITRLSSLGLATPLVVASSCLLFSLGHIYQGPAAVFFTLVQGLAFALIFLRKRSIHSLALAHGLYNFAVFFLGTLFFPE
jgi:membrane protease YdiL (CAAX protease family)